MKGQSYFIGVDVGTRSVRAALVSDSGHILSVAVTPITVYNVKKDFYEQSSNEIWKAVCSSVKKVLVNVDKESIKGVGFDATCSLVVLDKDFLPISVSPYQDEDQQNVIMWMDHRAKEEADLINSKPYKFLKYVGGKVSLEMQMPKLLWLKQNFTKCWCRAEHFLDLPDFLTFKATGNLSRSLCSLVCKWTFLSDGVKQGWDQEFLEDVGLQDLMDGNFSKIGQKVMSPGEEVGRLTKESADELGLLEGTSVGASLIDAHAGGLALVYGGLTEGGEGAEDIFGRLGLICGTSTCHMCLSKEPHFVRGVWGPYLSAMVPQLWLNEGGQSATGSLVDFIVRSHPAAKSCPKEKDVYTWLEEVLQETLKTCEESDISFLTRRVHVYPDFHGNRAPLADASFRGMVCGLTLDNGIENLALMYLATLQAVAYGTKDIVEQLEKSGYDIKTVLMCGGLSNSKTFIQIHADVLDLPVLIPHTKESVLLGAAMLGASASGALGLKGDLGFVATEMAGDVDRFHPRKEMIEFHQKKYQVFKKMQQDQIGYNEIMGKN